MLRVHNTLTRQVEPVAPLEPGRVKLYSCGPTVYRYAHVGNMRTFLLTDLIRRVAGELHHLRVTAVQNITDVGHLEDDTNDTGDDKVLAQARREGKTTQEIAEASAGNLQPVPWIEASDVAEAVVFLVSDKARYVTGSQYVLDAGLLTA